MPAPVRYRSTAAVYDEGEADRGTTRARGSRSALLLPGSVTGSIVTPAPQWLLCVTCRAAAPIRELGLHDGLRITAEPGELDGQSSEGATRAEGCPPRSLASFVSVVQPLTPRSISHSGCRFSILDLTYRQWSVAVNLGFTAADPLP